MFGRLLDNFCKGLRVLLGLLMGALAIPVFMQVISRYTGIIPTYLWTEELATYLFIWIVMIGSMVAVWDGTHFDVRVTGDAKSRIGRLVQNGFVHIGIIIFSVLFMIYGFEYVAFGNNQRSVMKQANLAYIYVSVPLAGAVWVIFAGYRLFQEMAIFHKSADPTS